MNEKLLHFINNSFLKELLNDDCITDISYNGVSVFYLHNRKGRIKAEINVSSNYVLDFIRQIANYSEKQFSFTNPFLDISVGKYRLNAVHPSIVRVKNDKACSFSMRISSEESRITNNYDFINEKCRSYLKEALLLGKSIVISGSTGSGKTELQKFLMLNLQKNTRVIVIDNIEELEYVRVNEDIDLTSWQVSQNNTSASIQELVRNALRSNPDWLIVAESRGKEMNEVLNSVMTGHPIITTLHSESLEDIPQRICRMVEMAETSEKHENILNDIFDHIKICVFLKKEITSSGVKRYVESIAELQKDHSMKIIYKRR